MRDEMGWDRACHFSFWCELGFALGFRFGLLKDRGYWKAGMKSMKKKSSTGSFLIARINDGRKIVDYAHR
jgi:hypothetical protein